MLLHVGLPAHVADDMHRQAQIYLGLHVAMEGTYNHGDIQRKIFKARYADEAGQTLVHAVMLVQVLLHVRGNGLRFLPVLIPVHIKATI